MTAGALGDDHAADDEDGSDDHGRGQVLVEEMTARVTATTGTKYAATPSLRGRIHSAAIRKEVNGMAVANRPRARSKTHCCVSIEDSESC